MGPLGFEPRSPAPEAGILAKLDYGPSALFQIKRFVLKLLSKYNYLLTTLTNLLASLTISSIVSSSIGVNLFPPTTSTLTLKFCK